MRRGLVDCLDWQHDSWRIDHRQLSADRAFLATGSAPQDTDVLPGVPVIPLDEALIPSKLPGRYLSVESPNKLAAPQYTRLFYSVKLMSLETQLPKALQHGPLPLGYQQPSGYVTPRARKCHRFEERGSLTSFRASSSRMVIIRRHNILHGL